MSGVFNMSLSDRQRIGAGIFRPERLSEATADGTTNVTKIQAAITLAAAWYVTTGRQGVVQLDQRGTFPVAGVTVNAYQAGTKYLWDIPSGVRIIADKQCTFRLNDGAQTDATGSVFGFAFQDKSKITLEGELTFDMNAQGQTGWTGGYAQNGAGPIRGYTATAASAGLHNIIVDGWRLLNCFGNPVNLGQFKVSTNLILRNLYCERFGEGLQLTGCLSGSEMYKCRLYDRGTMVGDGFEYSGCTGGINKDCEFYGFGMQTAGGTCFDLYGSIGIVVSGFRGIGGSNIFSQQIDTIYPLVIPTKNVLSDSTFDGFNGAVFGHGVEMTISNCNFNRCGYGNSGYVFYQEHSVADQGAVDQLTDTRFYSCNFNGCTGLLIASGKLRLFDTNAFADVGAGRVIQLFKSGVLANPELHVVGGRLQTLHPGYTSIQVTGTGAAFAPVIKIRGADLRGSPNGSFVYETGGADTNESVSADSFED